MSAGKLENMIADKLKELDRTPSPTVEPVKDFTGKADGGGFKQSMVNPLKLWLWLVPGALVRSCARAMMYGAKKYAAHNWRRGMSWSEVLGALDRHLQAIKDGEMIDPESGLHHFDHMAANLGFLCEFKERPEYQKFNDLFVRPTSDDKCVSV